MFVNEHAPAHFHAYYQEFEASIAIENGTVKGYLPPRVLGFVQEWRVLHAQELLDNWQHALEDGNFRKIKPLE